MSSPLLTVMRRQAADTWSPGQLSDLSLLLDATSLPGSAGDAVTLWSDASSMVRDAAAASGSEPAISTIGTGPAIAFDNGKSLTVGDGGQFSELHDATRGAAFLFKTSYAGDYQTLFAKNTAGTFQLFFLTDQGDYHMWRWQSISTDFGVCDGVPHLAFYDVDSTTGAERLIVDGIAFTATYNAALSGWDGGAAATIGCASGGGFQFHGEQSLIILRTALWTETEMSRVRAYCVEQGWINA